MTCVINFFWKMDYLTLRARFETLIEIFKQINFFTKPVLKHKTKAILTSTNLIMKRQIRLC